MSVPGTGRAGICLGQNNLQIHLPIVCCITTGRGNIRHGATSDVSVCALSVIVWAARKRGAKKSLVPAPPPLSSAWPYSSQTIPQLCPLDLKHFNQQSSHPCPCSGLLGLFLAPREENPSPPGCEGSCKQKENSPILGTSATESGQACWQTSQQAKSLGQPDYRVLQVCADVTQKLVPAANSCCEDMFRELV